jgi:RNA polymerase sigma-70 factor (ECF subfamily)
MSTERVFSSHRAGPVPPEPPGSVDEVYERYFDFVWRNVRRMGVPEGAVDDAVQDVFLVVHRRLGEFQGRSSLETWLFGILLRVLKEHRRASSRRSARLAEAEAVSRALAGRGSEGPHDLAARNEAVRSLYRLLDQLDDEKRAIFVLVELEQLPVIEAAAALGLNVNTAYARLRAARQQFETALEQHRAREKVVDP